MAPFSTSFVCLIYWALPVLSSFLAVGPPAAPKLRSLGSANTFQEFELGGLADNYKDGVYSLKNATFNTRVIHDEAQGMIENGVDNLEVQSSYFWLSDPQHEHKVYSFSQHSRTLLTIKRCLELEINTKYGEMLPSMVPQETVSWTTGLQFRAP
jgi:hypothetical protein